MAETAALANVMRDSTAVQIAMVETTMVAIAAMARSTSITTMTTAT